MKLGCSARQLGLCVIDQVCVKVDVDEKEGVDAEVDPDEDDRPEEWKKLKKYAEEDAEGGGDGAHDVEDWLDAMGDYITETKQDEHLSKVIKSVSDDTSKEFLLHVMVRACERRVVAVCVRCPTAWCPRTLIVHTAFIAGSYKSSSV